MHQLKHGEQCRLHVLVMLQHLCNAEDLWGEGGRCGGLRFALRLGGLPAEIVLIHQSGQPLPVPAIDVCIQIGHHIGLRVTRIPLDRLDVTTHT